MLGGVWWFGAGGHLELFSRLVGLGHFMGCLRREMVICSLAALQQTKTRHDERLVPTFPPIHSGALRDTVS